MRCKFNKFLAIIAWFLENLRSAYQTKENFEEIEQKAIIIQKFYYSKFPISIYDVGREKRYKFFTLRIRAFWQKLYEGSTEVNFKLGEVPRNGFGNGQASIDLSKSTNNKANISRQNFCCHALII